MSTTTTTTRDRGDRYWPHWIGPMTHDLLLVNWPINISERVSTNPKCLFPCCSTSCVWAVNRLVVAVYEQTFTRLYTDVVTVTVCNYHNVWVTAEVKRNVNTGGHVRRAVHTFCCERMICWPAARTAHSPPAAGCSACMELLFLVTPWLPCLRSCQLALAVALAPCTPCRTRIDTHLCDNVPLLTSLHVQWRRCCRFTVHNAADHDFTSARSLGKMNQFSALVVD